MNRIQLEGVDGSNPLGFLAAMGLVRMVPDGRLGFADDGSFRAFVEGPDIDETALAALVANDAEASRASGAPWRLTYTKAATKKQGPQVVADLKPPPEAFRGYLNASLHAWLAGDEEAASYAAAYCTDIAVDGKGNTKPMAFHFTAAQQTFLGAVEGIRASVTQEWVETSLFRGNGERPGSNLRWDPGAERNWALLADNPSIGGTRVNAPLEWLAFRGLPLLPSFPRGTRIITTGVVGRGDDMTFRWPLWSIPATMATIRSALSIDWTQSAKEHAARGVFAVCSSSIRRTSQGFGNFGPSSIAD